MRISDTIIIYLTIGSPFAVHYFSKFPLNHTRNHLLRTISVLFFWPFYSIWATLRVKLTKRDRSFDSSESYSLDARLDKKVDEVTLAMEMFLQDSLPEMPLFEFREVIDRYVGLTFAFRSDIDHSNRGLGQILNGPDGDRELHSICINRRNRKALESHRNRARLDFLTLVSNAIDADGSDSAFVRSALELSRVISDDDAFRKIGKLVASSEQTPVEISVTTVEREVWHSQTPKQSTAGQM